ncbi:MAG: hypothetical protein LUP94_00350 [Candidatus Methanomethylicus sp.]|nr:hypothetical protein [Candidatus Methanomethylicus sp.]
MNLPRPERDLLFAVVGVIAFSIVSFCLLQPVMAEGSSNQTLPQFFTSTNQGVVRVFENGSTQLFSFRSGYSLEVYGDEIYVNQNYRRISIYSLDGVYLRNISIPSSVTYLTFATLPNGGIAFFDNDEDKIFIVNSTGNLVASVNMSDSPNDSLQNVDGVVVNNQLIVSEDGNSNVLRVDLTTYQVSVFKNLSEIPTWIGAIDYSNGYYYVCGPNSIYRFMENTNSTKVAEVPDENIVGIAVVDNYAYVAVNFGGKIYKVDLKSGASSIFASNLSYPEDLDVARAITTGEDYTAYYVIIAALVVAAAVATFVFLKRRR